MFDLRRPRFAAQREQWRQDRKARLQAELRPFKRYEPAERFLDQFRTERLRYDFLWLRGPTKKGKTQLHAALLLLEFNLMHPLHNRNSWPPSTVT